MKLQCLVFNNCLFCDRILRLIVHTAQIRRKFLGRRKIGQYVENSWEEGRLDSSFWPTSRESTLLCNFCIVDLSFLDCWFKSSISAVWFKGICITICIVCIMSAGSTLCPGKPWMTLVKFTVFSCANDKTKTSRIRIFTLLLSSFKPAVFSLHCINLFGYVMIHKIN